MSAIFMVRNGQESIVIRSGRSKEEKDRPQNQGLKTNTSASNPCETRGREKLAGELLSERNQGVSWLIQRSGGNI